MAKRRVLDEEGICAAYRNGDKVSDITLRYGISRSLFATILARNNVEIRDRIPEHSTGEVKLTQELVEGLHKEYVLGASLRSLAKREGVTVSGLSIAMARYGLRAQEKLKKPKYDESFFDVIDSEEKAYILGLLAADGYVHDVRNIISLSLVDKESERELLMQINDLLGRPSTVKWYSSARKCRALSSAEYRLSFKSSRMRRSLNALGIVQAKTMSFSPPVLSEELELHFARGLVDGDGHIVNDESRTAIGLCGNRDTVEWFERLCAKHVGGVRSVTFSSGVWRVSVEGDPGARMMGKLYAGAKIALRRKRVLAESMQVIEVDDGVQKVGQETAKQFFLEYHYLRSLPVGCVSYGLFDKGRLCGVASVGAPSFPDAWRGIFVGPKKMSELRRFALVPNLPKNTASSFLAEVLRLVRKNAPNVDCMLTYADSEEGHYGGIYQAVGAKYIGRMSQLIVEKNGVRTPVSRAHNPDALAALAADGGVVRMDAGKHKYLILLVRGEERARVEAEIAAAGCVLLPYPKAPQ